MPLGSHRPVAYERGLGDNDSLQQSLVQCQRRQSTLSIRVAALECQSNAYVAIPRGSPLRAITNCTKAIFPDRKVSDGLKELFNVLYVNRKGFHSHINKTVRGELLPFIRMDICRESRKQFTP